MADTSARTEERTISDRPQVLTALVVGGALTLVGVLGFLLVPDEGLLFGLFGVNTLHNALHLLTGLL
jgi:hypothetical protein